MGLFLGFQSYSIGLYFCFCASSILSWWPYLCSIIWSQEGWFPPASFFFLKTALVIRGLLCFHMNCESFCSSSVKKKTIDNLIGVPLNLQIAFGSIVIFTVLILPTQERGISLCLCHLWFLFKVSYDFLCTVLLSPQVSLFLDI